MIIIIFTYFYKRDEEKIANIKRSKNALAKMKIKKFYFEDVQYEGLDKNGNKFIINSDFAEFESDKSNLIYETIVPFFLKMEQF